MRSYSVPSRRKTIGTRQPCRIRAEHILERIGRRDVAAAESHDLVAIAEPAAIRVAVFEDVVDHDASVGVGRDHGPERRMIHEPAALEMAHEPLRFD